MIERNLVLGLGQKASEWEIGTVPRWDGEEGIGFIAELIVGDDNREFPQKEASKPPLRKELKLTLKTYPF